MSQRGITILEVMIAAMLIMTAGAALLTLLYVANAHLQIQPATASYLAMNKIDQMAGAVRASQWSNVADPMYITASPRSTAKTLEGKNYDVSYTVSNIPGRAEMRKVNVKVTWEMPV